MTHTTVTRVCRMKNRTIWPRLKSYFVGHMWTTLVIMSGKNTLTYQIQQTGTLTQRMQRIFPNKIFSCCIQFCPFLDRLLFPSSFYLQVFFRASIGLLQASSKVFSAKFFKKFQIFFYDFQNSTFL